MVNSKIINLLLLCQGKVTLFYCHIILYVSVMCCLELTNYVTLTYIIQIFVFLSITLVKSKENKLQIVKLIVNVVWQNDMTQ